MEKEISLIAFLDEVVSRNTQHYRKILNWMLRSCVTH